MISNPHTSMMHWVKGSLFLMILGFLGTAHSAPVFAAQSKKGQLGSAEPLAAGVEALDASLKKQALDYIAFRKNRMPAKKKLDFIASCLSEPEQNFFCNFLPDQGSVQSDEESQGSGPSLDIADQRPLPGTLELVSLLEKGSPSDFSSIPETRIHRALRHFRSWEPLNRIAEKVLDSRCHSTTLPTALAHKAEEYFPETKYRDLAVRLFSRASECGDDESAKKARYRASLLHIWNGECGKAKEYLVKLSEEQGGDYVSRSLFWRAHCAKQVGNKLLASAFQNRLIKENPLSYHGLVLTQGKSKNLFRIMSESEFDYLARSESHPDLNDAIRAVEILHELKEPNLANELLDGIGARLGEAELHFQLYAAMLRGQSGDSIGKFKILANVFREDPATITRATLKMFYPLSSFELLKKYGGERVDPFLLAALIRQESGFNPRARSPAGALGLMQLMPATARGLQRRVSRRQLLSPKTNIRLGVKYFQGLLTRFDNDAELALAAYNAGPHNVQEWLRRYPTDNRMLFFDLIPFRETRNYVALIARNYFWYVSLYANERPSSRKPLMFTLYGSSS